MEWFSSIIEHLTSSKTLSIQSKSIENLIGSKKKIWEVNELKESLKNFIPSEMVNALNIYELKLIYSLKFLSFRMTI
jgi:hypothetical protein